jgi:hypothetical protein
MNCCSQEIKKVSLNSHAPTLLVNARTKDAVAALEKIFSEAISGKLSFIAGSSYFVLILYFYAHRLREEVENTSSVSTKVHSIGG